LSATRRWMRCYATPEMLRYVNLMHLHEGGVGGQVVVVIKHEAKVDAGLVPSARRESGGECHIISVRAAPLVMAT